MAEFEEIARYYVCDNPDCSLYMVQRKIVPPTIGFNAVAIVGAACRCRPYIEMRPVSPTEEPEGRAV